jgi:hypothetical protein
MFIYVNILINIILIFTTSIYIYLNNITQGSMTSNDIWIQWWSCMYNARQFKFELDDMLIVFPTWEDDMDEVYDKGFNSC